jgi:hypothetical protein
VGRVLSRHSGGARPLNSVVRPQKVTVPQTARFFLLPGLLLLAGLLLELVHGGMGGLLFSFALVIILVWLLYSLLRLPFRSADRATRAARMGIWFATIVVITIALGYRDRVAREEVEAAIASVKDHKHRTGSYPASLTEAGLDIARLRSRYSVGYFLEAGDPVILYSQPSMPLVAHRFHFKTGTWERLD